MFKHKHIITAIEIGTSKICVLIAETDSEGNMTVLAHGECPSEEAVSKGEIVNMDQVIRSLDEAIEEAESAAEVEIDTHNLYISVTGSHIRSYKGIGRILITGEERRINADHVVEALRNATVIPILPGYIMLNSIDGNFIIDGMRRLSNPIDQIGNKLEAFSHIICGNRNSVENFQTPLRELGYDSSIPVFSALASATGVLTDDELEYGVLLIDMGAGTTEYILFHNSGVHASGIIPIGCEHLANDLSIGLEMNINICRKLIVDSPRGKEGGAFIEIEGTLGSRKIPVNTIEKVFDLRLRETFNLIHRQIKEQKLLPLMDRGIVLCGGAAMLPQVNDIVYSIFEAPVRTGYPIELSGAVTDLKSPRYSMIVGLLKHGERDRQTREAVDKSEIIKSLDRRILSFWKKTKRYLKEAIKF